MNSFILYVTYDWFELKFGSNSQNVNESPAYQFRNRQSEKFVKEFDANCYISLTNNVDNHDISKGRDGDVIKVLKSISQPTLVIGKIKG